MAVDAMSHLEAMAAPLLANTPPVIAFSTAYRTLSL